MTFDPHATDLALGVVGSGAMGRGIAQIALLAGVRVALYDSRPEALAAACQELAATLDKLVAKGRLGAAEADAAKGRLTACASLAMLAPLPLIVEAIVEDLTAKRALFAELEALVAPTTVLASNTSSLSITALARGLAHPGRLVGWHFFNPVPLMRVAEVIDGLLSDERHGDALMELTRRLGHTAVRAKDTPGFIVNHAGRGFGTEALRIVGEGIAGFADVDRVLREACGFRLGPFELMDLTALDVSHPVMESIYHQFYEEARFRPSVITAQRLAGGLLGRKTQRGFYDYGAAATPPVEAAPEGPLPASVHLSIEEGPWREALAALVSPLTAVVPDPAAAELVVVAPLGLDATRTALARGLDAEKTVALDPFTPLELRRTLMTTPVTRAEVRRAAHVLFGGQGVAATVIHDSPGFIAQRVVASIVNIACDIAQQRIASPGDIDLAVRLGLNYPAGPLALGDQHGARRVLSILENMFTLYGDPRYRPSPWLARRALLGVSLLTAEG